MIKIKASGRVCLFGDHQDYLGLPVIACGIDKYIFLEAVPNETQTFDITFEDLKETRVISISQRFKNYDSKDGLIAALKVLEKHQCIANEGYTISIRGTIPINAGLSSSSALILAWIGFLLKAYGKAKHYSQEFIAKIAFEAEVLERNGPGGKMDQYSIALGNIIYLETGPHTTYKTFKKELPGMVIGESGIAKDTLGLLADRRSLAIEALEFLKGRSPSFHIKKVSSHTVNDYLNQLPEHLRPYFSAAVQNHLITQSALQEFEKKELHIKTLGTLMNAHHTILKNDLKITVPKIDDMIDAAIRVGAYGAKIVGSGGGGCIVALAPQEKQGLVINEIKKAGARNAYGVSISKGIQLHQES